MTRPLLLLDVDGVLNPLVRRSPPGFLEYQLCGFPVHLSPSQGRALLTFADRFELAWASTWEQEANSLIAPILGLPALPVVEVNAAQYKSQAIGAYAGVRPLIWLDDDAGVIDTSWARRRNKTVAPTKIVHINAARGLQANDLV
jgi:hypothetical protein